MFDKARLKLTAWYLLIIMVISLSFSTIIYKSYSDEVDWFELAQRQRFERRLPPPTPPLEEASDLLAETKHRTLFTLIFINSAIFLISGGSGYLLAGRTLKPIKEMMDEQNQFVSDASHELKTPLTSLKSVFEVYLRDKDGTLKEAKEIISESVLEVNKLQALSDYLLKLSRFQRPIRNFEPVNLDELVANAVKKVDPMAKERQIIIAAKIKKVKLNGDKNYLSELATILLDNAVKYSSNNSRVEVRLSKNKNQAVFEVEDHGIGIRKTDIPHIFDRFYRSEKARSSPGFGLGLAIASEVVKAHKGAITVKSQEGRGTIFTVNLNA